MVPTIAKMPIANGRAAATTRPKTHEHHEAERQRERLDEHQILASLVGGLPIDGGLAAGADGDAVAVLREFVGELSGELRCLVVVAGDAGQDQSRLAVLADQARGAAAHGDAT